MEQLGKYTIVAEIGQGATSTVYKAHDAALDRLVAVKVILADPTGDDDTLRRRFEREAQAAALLNHPNIVTVYDFGQQGDKLYMAMELLEGIDLKQALAEGRLTTLDEKLDMLAQVGEGLAFAHAHGIVHRDLKPANIHLLPTGRPKIMDFGLARLLWSDITRTGLVIGTPHYMSPEQVRGERVDPRSDVFSLGSILYELLAGRRAFEAESLHAVMYLVMHNEPTPIAQLVPDLPPVLAQVVESAMVKDRSLRLADAGEFGDFLGRARSAMRAGRAGEVLPRLTRIATRQSSGGALPLPGGGGPGPNRPALPAPRPPRKTSTRRWSPRRAALYLGGVALVAAVASLLVLTRRLVVGARSPSSAEGTADLDSLTRTLVETQVELSRKRLAAGDPDDAVQQAERALGFDPRSTAARQALEEARSARDRIGSAANDARASAGRGDMALAAAAFWRLIQDAPDHSTATELAPALEAMLKPQAEAARRTMEDSRRAAQQAQADRTDEFTEGAALARDGEEAERRGAYATSACAFMKAAHRFRRARR